MEVAKSADESPLLSQYINKVLEYNGGYKQNKINDLLTGLLGPY